MVGDKTTLNFLAPLEAMVGKTIPTKEFIEQFESEQGTEPKKIGADLYILLNEGKSEKGFRTIHFSLNSNPIEMGRLTSEVLYTTLLEDFTRVKYIGKMLTERGDKV